MNTELFNFKNILANRYINWFANLSFLYFFIVCWSAIFFVINSSFKGYFLKEDNLIPILNKIFYIHSSLLILPLFFLFYVIFKKNINKLLILVMVAISFCLPIYDFLDQFIHPFLLKLNIYNFLLKPGQMILNPQYTKIFLYIITLLILSLLILFKKTRSMDRIFIFLIGSSVLFTTLLFHVVIPSGFFAVVRNQTYQTVVKNFESKSFENGCRQGICFIINKESILIKDLNEKEESFSDYKWFTEKAINFLEVNKAENTVSSILNNFKGQRFDYSIGIIKKINYQGNTFYLFFIDDKIMKPYSRISEIWFSFLTSAAHSIWIFGGLLLIFFHKNRFSKRPMHKEDI